MSIKVESEESFIFEDEVLIEVTVDVLALGDSLDRKFVERRVITRALMTAGLIEEGILRPVQAASRLSDKARIVRRESLEKGPLGITRKARYLVRIQSDEG